MIEPTETATASETPDSVFHYKAGKVDDLGALAHHSGPPKQSTEAQPAPQNDDIHGETDAAPEASRFQKIREAGAGLFRKFNLKRGPGRPRLCPICRLAETDCQGHVAPGPDGAPVVVPPGQAGPAPADIVPRDPLIVKRSIAAMARALRKFADKLIYSKAVQATGDKAFALDVTKECSATEDECDALGEVTDILLKEMGLDTKYLPLAAALVIVVGAGTRYTLTIKTLNKQINDKRRAGEPGKVK